MSNEEKIGILQILYEKRSDFPYSLAREELAHRVGKSWYEIQPDVTDLEKEGYLVTERREIKSLIFHRLSITTKGVKFVEKPPLRKIDIFISSPSDVYEERQIAKRVVERYNRLPSIAERYVLRLLAYEESAPAEVGNRPQDIIDRYIKAGSSDLFICILWHRMGTRLTHEKTGESFPSGTAYEFFDAYNNYQKCGKPYMLLYRGMKPSPQETEPQQLEAVEAFFKRFDGEHAELKALFKKYQSNEEFEKMLDHDIDLVLSTNLIV
jgi:uncharacterized protein DUF4062